MITDSPAPRKSHALAWIAAILLIPMLYVLSAGPVLACTDKALERGSISDDTSYPIYRFYAPLDSLRKIPGGEQILRDYMAWWSGMIGAW